MLYNGCFMCLLMCIKYKILLPCYAVLKSTVHQKWEAMVFNVPSKEQDRLDKEVCIGYRNELCTPDAIQKQGSGFIFFPKHLKTL